MGAEARLEDFHVGDRCSSALTVEVTAEAIMAFARQFDPQPGHVSEETALTTPFLGLAASGWHTAALTMKLLVSLGYVGMIGASVDLTWPTPTRPGDRLHIDLVVTGVRVSRGKPDRGVVEFEYDTINQANEIRQHTRSVAIVRRRDGADASTDRR